MGMYRQYLYPGSMRQISDVYIVPSISKMRLTNLMGFKKEFKDGKD